MKNIKLATCSALAAAAIMTSACSSTDNGGFSGGARRSKSSPPPSANEEAPTKDSKEATSSADGAPKIVSKDTLAGNIDVIMTPSGKAEVDFAEVAKTPLSDYFDRVLEAATNEPLEVDGHTLVGARDFLLAHEDVLDSLSRSYETFGEYAASYGVFSPADMHEEDYEQGLELVETVLNSGLESIVGSSDVESDDPDRLELRQASGLNLTDVEGCTASVVGTVAGVVGTAASCIVTVGFGCAAGAVGTAASIAGVVKSCPKSKESVDTQGQDGQAGADGQNQAG